MWLRKTGNKRPRTNDQAAVLVLLPPYPPLPFFNTSVYWHPLTLASLVKEVDTLINNGDLTAYFHPHQLLKYTNHFHDLPGNVKHFYPSLGNHDLKNNIDGGQFGIDEWGPFLLNGLSYTGLGGCNAEHAADYIRGGVSCGTVPR